MYAPLIAHTNIPVDADIPSGDPSPVVGLFLTWLYVTVFHPLEELVILVLEPKSLGGVHKLRLQEEGGRWSKKLTFCKVSYHRKCKSQYAEAKCYPPKKVRY